MREIWTARSARRALSRAGKDDEGRKCTGERGRKEGSKERFFRPPAGAQMCESFAGHVDAGFIQQAVDVWANSMVAGTSY